MGSAPCPCIPCPHLGSPCRDCCQSSGSNFRSSPSELLRLELELGLGLGPGPGPAKQAKRKGLTGKMSLKELSKQCSGEGLAADPV